MPRAATPNVSPLAARLDRVALLAALAWFAAVIFPCQHPGLDDAFYHLAQARAMVRDGLATGVDTLPLTVLGAHGPDHHFLLHLLQLPLAWLPYPWDVRLGMLAFGWLACGGFWAWLRWSRVPLPGVWTLFLLAGSEVFGFRMSLLRGQSLDLPLLLFGASAAARARPKLALVAALLFAWAHHAAVLLVPVAALAFGAARLATGRWQLRAPLWLVGGLLLGQIVNPWLPRNIEYLLFHVLFKTGDPLHLSVGPEWLPALPSWIVSEFALQHAVLAALGLLAWRRRLKPQADTLTFALLLPLTVAMTLQHGRFADLLAAVEVAAIALLARDLAALAPLLLRPWSRMAPVLAALVLLTVARGVAVSRYLDDGSVRLDAWQRAAAVLQAQTQPGEVVVNLDWGEYCQWTYVAPQLRWAIGLDPYYLAYRRPQTFRTWAELNQGRQNIANLRDKLDRQFGARFLVGSANYAGYLQAYPELEWIYHSQEASIWRVRDRPLPLPQVPRDP